MKYIFVDNFRGFENTIVPLRDVNFLVGENSTGKTSLLALIKLLTTSSFWVGGIPHFGSEGVGLGNYQDIVSVGAKDKNYFRIGLFWGREHTGDNFFRACLITFKEREGMPFVSRYTFVHEELQLQFKFASKIQYKYSAPPTLSHEGEEEIHQMFLAWSQEHKRSTGRYTTLRLPIQMFRTPLGTSLAMMHFTFLREGVPAEKDVFNIDFTKVGSSFGLASMFTKVSMLAPIRTRPKRIYDEYDLEFSPEGKHTPYLIKRYFRKRTEKDNFLRFISKFGETSGLFKTIEVKSFGHAVTSPFELDVAINGTFLKLINVGYGVSQVLPVIVEMFEQGPNTLFLIQQPEIHLHPRAQSALGELFYDLAILENKAFIVETHSDFIIDSFRFSCRAKEGKKPESQILYFERSETGNHLFSIAILENGDLPEEQPVGYRDFFMKQQMRMLGY